MLIVNEKLKLKQIKSTCKIVFCQLYFSLFIGQRFKTFNKSVKLNGCLLDFLTARLHIRYFYSHSSPVSISSFTFSYLQYCSTNRVLKSVSLFKTWHKINLTLVGETALLFNSMSCGMLQNNYIESIHMPHTLIPLHFVSSYFKGT